MMKQSDYIIKREWLKISIAIISFACIFVMGIETNATSYTGSNGLIYELNDTDMTAEVTGCSTSATNINIPSYVTVDETKQYKVNAIADSAFYNHSNLVSITIPDGVTCFGDSIFQNCTSLESVRLPRNMTSICYQMFYNCEQLSSITIPDSVTEIDDRAFCNCSALTKIALPDQLLRIGGAAFANTGITSITIPSNVNSIESSAFSTCTDLAGVVTIPEGVTTISNRVFYGCEQIEVIELPSTITDIEENAFYGCGNLSGTVTLPEGVTSIAAQAFYLCDSITSVELPDTLKTIGTRAFYGCKSWSGNLSLPNSVTDVGDEAFKSCEGLTAIAFSSGMTTIPTEVNYGCVSLKNIIFPDTITSIETRAFFGCTLLEGIVELPSNVTNIGQNAFGNCNNLTGIVFPKSLTTVSDYLFPEKTLTVYYPEGARMDIYDDALAEITYKVENDNTVSLNIIRNIWLSDDGNQWYTLYDVYLPEDIYGKPISSFIRSEVYPDFFDELDIEEYQISEVICATHYVKDWGNIEVDYHKRNCKVCGMELAEKHNFSNGVNACECGYVPFTMTSNNSNEALEMGYAQAPTLSVSAKATLGTETITYQWYENDTAIAGATDASYTIPTGKAVGSYAYYCKVSCGDYSIKTDETSVVVYESETIGGIKLINPCYVTPVEGDYIKDESNSGIYKVLTVTTTDDTSPATIAYVKPVFDTAKEGVIPDTITVGGITYKVTSIDPAAFKGNKKITKVTIGNNITAIPDNAFKGCTALTTVKIGTCVKTIGKSAFYGCKKLKNVTIGKNVTTIGDKAFYKCTALTKITLPSKVTKIGKSAFQGCTKLKTVTAKAKKLTKIGAKAFYGCKKLTKLTLKSTKLTKKSVGKNAFKKTNKKLVVKVPKSKVKKYKAYFKNKGNKTIKVKK